MIGPHVDNLFTSRDVIAIVHVWCSCPIRRVEVTALAQLEIAVAVLPGENTVFRTLVFRLFTSGRPFTSSVGRNSALLPASMVH